MLAEQFEQRICDTKSFGESQPGTYAVPDADELAFSYANPHWHAITIPIAKPLAQLVPYAYCISVANPHAHDFKFDVEDTHSVHDTFLHCHSQPLRYCKQH